uniref:Uncharacterized protein n=1 Tax=Rhizophora mucronata TaxID=61149 RepID=A0A2P2PX45_RHIMU
MRDKICGLLDSKHMCLAYFSIRFPIILFYIDVHMEISLITGSNLCSKLLIYVFNLLS